MHRNRLNARFGLTFNPFAPDAPLDALFVTPRIESFCARVESMVHDGGFALVTGDPGNGKSVVLRILAARLGDLPEVIVGPIARPQSGLADFYRELGDLFQVDLRPHNRWGGFKALRERWHTHAEQSRLRPVVLVDEAQEMAPLVLNELRLLASGPFDAETYLTVVLAGDARLTDRFRHPDLVPLGSRIRTRLVLEYANRDDLTAVLEHALAEAGAPELITKAVRDALVEHAAGNYRVMMTAAGELLMAAAEKGVAQIDEKLYFELFEQRSNRRPNAARSKAKAR